MTGAHMSGTVARMSGTVEAGRWGADPAVLRLKMVEGLPGAPLTPALAAWPPVSAGAHDLPDARVGSSGM
jgi:hypothetical protein